MACGRPPGLAPGPELYLPVGWEATARPLPQDSKLVAFGPKSTTAKEIASGARLAVDVELGPGRTLFALSQGVWRVNGDGNLTTIIGGLNQPISLEIIEKTAYVVTLGGEIWAIDDIAGPPFGRKGASNPRAHGNPGGTGR